MGNHLSKSNNKLQRRIRAHNRTLDRQGKGNFTPNATGPQHKQHVPGSMNRRKQG